MVLLLREANHDSEFRRTSGIRDLIVATNSFVNHDSLLERPIILPITSEAGFQIIIIPPVISLFSQKLQEEDSLLSHL